MTSLMTRKSPSKLGEGRFAKKSAPLNKPITAQEKRDQQKEKYQKYYNVTKKIDMQIVYAMISRTISDTFIIVPAEYVGVQSRYSKSLSNEAWKDRFLSPKAILLIKTSPNIKKLYKNTQNCVNELLDKGYALYLIVDQEVTKATGRPFFQLEICW